MKKYYKYWIVLLGFVTISSWAWGDLVERGLGFHAPAVSGDPNTGIVHDPVEGEIVYDGDNEQFWGKISTSWQPLGLPPSSLTNGDVLTVNTAVPTGFAFSAPIAAPTGATMMWWSNTAPSGWILLNGATLGSDTSNAVFEGAVYEALFTYFWENVSNTDLQILTNSGSPTVRGANAAADFAADKQMPIPNTTGLVPRGTGAQYLFGSSKIGPALGGKHDDTFQGHWHSHHFRSGSRGSGGAQPIDDNDTEATNATSGYPRARNATSDGVNGTPRAGAETRPAAFGVTFIIKI